MTTDLSIDDGVVLCAIAEHSDRREDHRQRLEDLGRWEIGIGFCGARAREVARTIGDRGQTTGALNRIRRLRRLGWVQVGPGRFDYDPDEYALTDAAIDLLAIARTTWESAKDVLDTATETE